VEVTFYKALPFLAFLAYRLPVRARVPVIAAVALASLGWGLLPIHTAEGVNFLNWPPAYASWFAAGMLLAEWTVSPLGWPHALARNRPAIIAIALVAYLISASPLAGPKDLVPATLAQFVVRTSMGAVVAGALLAPLVLDRPGDRHAILGSRVMVTLGRWSYGLFVWHLAALVMVFPMVGTFMFNGDLIVVFVLTTVLGCAMAAVSYALIESPCRNALRRWEYRRSSRERTLPPPLDSSVTDAPEPAIAH
jgi:peptidoglycan/LPS O-acetylase OafA/YrhL